MSRVMLCCHGTRRHYEAYPRYLERETINRGSTRCRFRYLSARAIVGESTTSSTMVTYMLSELHPDPLGQP